MIRGIAQFVLKYPKISITLSLLVTVLLASGIRKVEIREDLKAMIPRDMPSRQALNELEEIFGGSDVFLITVGSEEEGIFNRRSLGKIIAITDSLEAMEGITRVTSLATVKHIASRDWGMEVIPFLEAIPETEEGIRWVKEVFYADSLYTGKLVSADEKYAAIIAVMDEDGSSVKVYRELVKLREAMEGPEEIYITGLPAVMEVVTHSLKTDLRRLIPFVIAVVVVILFLCFRTVLGVMLPLLAVLMSASSMVGLMGHLGIPFMVVNNMMPVILIAVGVSYGIHIVAGYYEELIAGHDKREALSSTINDVGTPVVMAGLTTMLGFLSLVTAPLPAYREMGALLSFGVFMALGFTITMIPAIFILLPAPKKVIRRVEPRFTDRLLAGIAGAVRRHRRGIIFLGAIITVIFAFGIPRLHMEMNPISFLPKSSEIRQADEKVNRHLGGSVNMNLLFQGDIESPEILLAMEEVENFLERFPETGSTMSLASIVAKINRVLNDDDPAYEVIPGSKAAVAQAILLYSMTGSPEDFEQFVDNSFENGQVMALMKSVSTKKIARIARETEKFCEESFSGIKPVKITGTSVFLKDLADMVIVSQTRSILFALLMVFLIAWVVYRSLVIGLLAIIPLGITVVLNFGLMGLSGISLSIPTVMISSIIIGIGIDFSFHFISRYKLEISRAAEYPVDKSIKYVGKPILFDAFPTAFGFMVLLTSSFLPLRFMGFLVALTMIVCAFGALTILAASLSLKNSPQKHRGR